MNPEFNNWLADFSAALQADDCLRVKDIVLRMPLDAKAVGREVVERMRYRMVGSPVWTDKMIRLEPRQ